MRADVERKAALLAGVILSMASLSGCGTFLETPVGSRDTVAADITETGDIGWYEITDMDRNDAGGNVTEIDLDNLEEGEDGKYSCEGGLILIFGGGDYVLRGKLDGGRVVINVFEDEIVHLMLDNVEIRSDRGAAVYVEKAEKVIVTAMENTENVMSDGAGYDERYRACIFSNSDLTVNGTGTMAVYGYHGDGMRSKDQVKIVSASLYVKAKGEGIRGNDGVIITDSVTEVECEGSGIMSDSQKDMVIIQGGSCKVVAGKNAITANRYVSVCDSQTDLYSVLEAIKCDGIKEVDGETPE